MPFQDDIVALAGALSPPGNTRVNNEATSSDPSAEANEKTTLSPTNASDETTPSRAQCALFSLPNEVLERIAEHNLDDTAATRSLALTCRRLFHIGQPLLYLSNDCQIFRRATRAGNLALMQTCAHHHAAPVNLIEVYGQLQDGSPAAQTMVGSLLTGYRPGAQPVGRTVQCLDWLVGRGADANAVMGEMVASGYALLPRAVLDRSGAFQYRSAVPMSHLIDMTYMLPRAAVVAELTTLMRALWDRGVSLPWDTEANMYLWPEYSPHSAFFALAFNTNCAAVQLTLDDLERRQQPVTDFLPPTWDWQVWMEHHFFDNLALVDMLHLKCFRQRVNMVHRLQLIANDGFLRVLAAIEWWEEVLEMIDDQGALTENQWDDRNASWEVIWA